MVSIHHITLHLTPGPPVQSSICVSVLGHVSESRGDKIHRTVYDVSKSTPAVARELVITEMSFPVIDMPCNYLTEGWK